ncbi:fimbria/pilus outer membrane usher protein [Sodalis sp. C49]|uniref:fimbria/pilus outer membrane usher protein n=1 Tax=Sodalis sp. C49 TaxID=3228929 RepID=UPI003965CB48
MKNALSRLPVRPMLMSCFAWSIPPVLPVLSLGLVPLPSPAQDYFNPNALSLKGAAMHTVDLSQFSDIGGQLPGIYRVDIYLNGNKVDTREVTFVASAAGLQPELTARQLAEYGVNRGAFPALRALPDDQPITALGQYIPEAGSTLNFQQLRLDLSVPQAALDSQARGYVDPSQWDQGLPALMLGYAYSGSTTWYDDQSGSDENHYLNLRSGANLGGWRLRNYSVYSNSSRERSHWDSINTYVQHDVQSLKGQFTAGDAYTPGTIFDSVPFRGAQLASDDNMLPDSLRGFAPVVRGIAQSNAQVTIRQNNSIIYQTYVAPGPFVITDLFPTAASGNLDVTIREASGAERRFTQPFSAVPIMQREGRLKYAASAGRYRSAFNDAREPNFLMGSLIYGLPGDTSVYGGSIASADYQSLLLGMGRGFGDLGSASFDVTRANTTLPGSDERHTGQSYRFQYAKVFTDYGTSFTLAGYRYSSKGFYDFGDANEMTHQASDAWQRLYNKRSRIQLNVSQSMGDAGSLYLAGYQQDYWQQSGYQRSLSAGYSLSHAGITYYLNYTFSQTPGPQDNDRQFAFSVQIPLSKWLPNSWATYSVNGDNHGAVNQQAGISGTLLADNNFNYSVQQSYGNRGTGASGSASASYRGGSGELNAGYNYSRHNRQVNYGAQGGVVAHPYGVTLSQSLGDTLALVRAPGADGVRVENNTGVVTDRRGYAVVPFATTYRRNRIALDTTTLGEDVDIDINTQTVIPTQGALALADFKTRVGSRVLLTITYRGQPVPFGTQVTQIQAAGESENSGIADAAGQVYLSGMPEQGRIKAVWGQGADQRCEAGYSLPAAASPTPSIRMASVPCR